MTSPRPRGASLPLVAALALVALAFPKLAAAQAVTPADLIGSWALPDSTQYGFTFRADSTMMYVGKSPDGKAEVKAHWRLATDTLVVSQMYAKVNGRSVSAKFARRLLALQNKKLTVTRLDNKQSAVYERVDSLANPPSSPTPTKP